MAIFPNTTDPRRVAIPPGYFLIPTNTVGTSLTAAGSPGTYGSYAQITAATTEAIYIVGVSLFSGTNTTYAQVMLAIGGSGAESGITEVVAPSTPAANDLAMIVMLPYPIAVASGIRIAAKAATGGNSESVAIHLMCIAQADLVSA